MTICRSSSSTCVSVIFSFGWDRTRTGSCSTIALGLSASMIAATAAAFSLSEYDRFSTSDETLLATLPLDKECPIEFVSEDVTETNGGGEAHVDDAFKCAGFGGTFGGTLWIVFGVWETSPAAACSTISNTIERWGRRWNTTIAH
ncbi:unnamed protein product [Haemonchus placei]|uniref:Uncharacterized protein n=1 Tax=Haemonchus placei TaxID=6290 RepID=A0A3P7VKT0_HAEPC|nr:unnamed protein product [Haemonchus placei]